MLPTNPSQVPKKAEPRRKNGKNESCDEVVEDHYPVPFFYPLDKLIHVHRFRDAALDRIQRLLQKPPTRARVGGRLFGGSAELDALNHDRAVEAKISTPLSSLSRKHLIRTPGTFSPSDAEKGIEAEKEKTCPATRGERRACLLSKIFRRSKVIRAWRRCV